MDNDKEYWEEVLWDCGDYDDMEGLKRYYEKLDKVLDDLPIDAATWDFLDMIAAAAIAYLLFRFLVIPLLT